MLFSQELDTLPSSIPLHALMTIHTPVITDKTPPLITIEGKEFNKFPTNNFLEAINAFFPWVYKTGNSYTYVVDGNVLQDINGLSLHDIEEVSFSRTNMDGRLYPFSRAGIFYIKTKRPRIADVAVNFNTQYNIASNDKKKLIIFTDPVGTEKETEVNNETGHLQSNHLSLSTKGKKLSFYSSVQFSSIKDPKLGQSGDFMVTTIPFSFGATDKTRQRNIGAFINLNYTISASFSAGLSANYFSSLNKADSSGFTEYTTSGNTNRAETAAKTKTSFTYYHISPYIAYQKGHLQNITRFEYANNEFQYDRQVYSVNTVSGASPSSFSSQAVETVKPYIRGYTIRNDLNYELIHKGKFTARPGVVFSYINQEIRYRQSETVWLSSNPIPGMFESWSYARQKITTLNPYLQLNFNNQFMGYAGHSFLLNKKNEIGVATTKHSRRSYYAGAVIDLVNLGIKKMDRLDVSFHYGNMTKNNSDNYWLQSVNNVDNFRPSGHFV
jgi:hypothetical protein